MWFKNYTYYCIFLLKTIAVLSLVIFYSKAISAPNDKEIDSLKAIISTSVNDSIKLVNTLKIIDLLAFSPDNNISIDTLVNNAEKIAKDSLQIFRLVSKLDRIGVNLRNNGSYFMALKLHDFALKNAKKIHNKQLLSIIYNNKGVVYRRLDDYQEALSEHLAALEISEETRNLESQAIAINSIGNIQMSIGNFDESLDFFKKSLIIEQKLNNKLGIAINLNNIGNVYLEQYNYEKALEYYYLSLDVNKEINSQKGIAICYNDIGRVLEKQNKLDDALSFFEKALLINLSIREKYGLAYSYLQIGEIYIRLEQYDKALRFIEPALKLSLEIKSKSYIMDSYYALYKISRSERDYENAFTYLELSHQYNDSINNTRIIKDITRLQIKHESERKENQIELLKQNAAISDLEIRRQKIIILLFLSALIIAVITAIFLAYYLTNKNKTNRLLLDRNNIIEKTKAELDNYSKQLLVAKQEAEETSRIKGEFLANMSHEIRTPLNSVIGFAEILEKSINDPGQLKYLNIIKSSSNTLLSLINDILDLSKIDAGKLDIVYEPINIKSIIEEIIYVFSHKASAKNIELRSDFIEHFHENLELNKLRLRQILFNLIGNAIKFTVTGTIKITAQTIKNENGLVDLLLSVTDTGFGIDDSEKDKIFEPFHQSKKGADKEGTGLGLTITKRLIQMMNGTITLETNQEMGSTFKIRIPDIKLTNEINSYSGSNREIINYDVLDAVVITNNYELCDTFSSGGIFDFKKKIVSDISEAIENISNKNLAIICGSSKEKLTESINEIKQHKNSNVKNYIVLYEGKDISQPSKPNEFWITATTKPSYFENIFRIVLKNIKLDEQSHVYFGEIFNSSNFIGIRLELINIYNNEYTRATNTKMSNVLISFSHEISKLADKYDLDGLHKYSAYLSEKVINFEIEEVDNLLEIFENNYNLIIEKVLT